MSARLSIIASSVLFVVHSTWAQDEGETYVYIPRGSEGAFPYVAVVTSKAGVCTGALLDKNWAITAAHCLYHRGKPIGGKEAKIQAGIVNYGEPNPKTMHETVSSDIVIHPSFVYNKVAEYDVALVSLRDPLESDGWPIKLSATEWPPSDEESTDQTYVCTMLGFGGNRSSTPNKNLKLWQISARHGADACPCVTGDQWKRLICVKERGYPRVCKGDDGGPLVCRDGRLRGLAHMIWDLDCDSTYPQENCMGEPGISVYTYLYPLNSWINGIVKRDVRKTPDFEYNDDPDFCRASGLYRRGLLVYFLLPFVVYRCCRV